VIDARVKNSSEYQTYIQQRRMIQPEFYTLGEKGIEKVNTP